MRLFGYRRKKQKRLPGQPLPMEEINALSKKLSKIEEAEFQNFEVDFEEELKQA